MSHFKMVAVDMDGTLLNSNLEISEKNKFAINELLEKDIKVIFATGRTFKAAQYYAKQINLDLPIITYNGALIKKIFSEEVLYSSKIEIDPARKLLSFAEENNIYVKAYIDDVLYVERKSEEAERFSKNNRISYKIIGKLSENIKSNPYMIVSIDTPNNINKLKKEFLDNEEKRLRYTSSTTYSLEVMANGISKGNALEKVCRHLNIKRDEVLTIGNSLNDLEMLQWSGLGVAMKNSDESLLKRHAVVSSHVNDDDGVYHVLMDLGII